LGPDPFEEFLEKTLTHSQPNDVLQTVKNPTPVSWGQSAFSGGAKVVATGGLLAKNQHLHQILSSQGWSVAIQQGGDLAHAQRAERALELVKGLAPKKASPKPP
jgi:hypothetical protein